MGIAVGGSQRGSIVKQTGLKAEIPQKAVAPPAAREPEVVVVQVLADGSLRINQQRVEWEALGDRLQKAFEVRANRTAFVGGDAAVEFQLIARVIDVMNAAGISSVGLLTPQLESGH